MLAALLLCTLGTPIANESGDSPAGDSSGEEEEEEVMVTYDLLSVNQVWDFIIGATARHHKEFEEEFQNAVKYHFLDNYRFPSLPADCPNSNFTMEACLERLAEGLSTYLVLFKHVESEYPNGSIVLEVRPQSVKLINLIKGKMRNPKQVALLTLDQEEQLLRDIYNPSPFHRKMTAHSILRQLHNFLLDGRVEIRRRERRRRPGKVIAPSYNFLQR
ncbi:interleukin-6-like [Solea solea]|uniref:interleukin-6-like n=1 Tax=Solea solea TaxID=90069 RepID=UPI002729B74A|nr:interleukin-6-like [Solea solea]